MNQIQKVTAELVAVIKGSTEYQNYKEQKDQMMQFPILKEKVDEFRKKNYELQNSRVDIFEEADKLHQEYKEVMNHPVVRKFLDAENTICRVVQQINWQLIETLDFDMDFEGKVER